MQNRLLCVRSLKQCLEEFCWGRALTAHTWWAAHVASRAHVLGPRAKVTARFLQRVTTSPTLRNAGGLSSPTPLSFVITSMITDSVGVYAYLRKFIYCMYPGRTASKGYKKHCMNTHIYLHIMIKSLVIFI